jgi:methyl-accepting chemotaxis protein
MSHCGTVSMFDPITEQGTLMARNLRFGALLIRLLHFICLAIAVLGIIYASRILQAADPAAAFVFVRLALAGFLVTALAIVVIITMLAARNLAKRVDTLAAALDQGASGNLTVRVQVTADDEVGRLATNLNVMLDTLENLILSINGTTTELARISSQNSGAAGQVLKAAEIQSAGVAQTSAAVRGINSSVGSVAAGVDRLATSATANAASIREMAASIHEVRENVTIQTEAIDEVTSAITEMAAVVDQIGANVNSLLQVSSTTTASVAEMDSSIKQVESSARETVTISGQVQDDAQQGKAAVEATIAGINEIRSSSKRTFDSISTLSERVAAIGRILSVIDGIAEQTNLLALNSAIIAAQAGEHGKGFAIVAGEIKELANRTRQSTMEIAELIKGVREETGKAVEAIRQTEEKVAEGESLSQNSGAALYKIVNGVQMAAGQVNEIARTTIEQAKGSQSINSAMRQVAQMVAQIARSCQEQATTNSSIIRMVERMKGCTTQVNNSSLNQERVGTAIAESTEKMGADFQAIKDACGEQSSWSRQIVLSVESVQQSADINLESARLMEAGVESLSTQIVLLRQEIARLQVSQERRRP